MIAATDYLREDSRRAIETNVLKIFETSSMCKMKQSLGKSSGKVQQVFQQ
jgi:hypothetical protein